MALTLRIGSRPSHLAITQTGLVSARLRELLPDLHAEIVPIKTTADRLASASVAQLGGKGLFIKELEEALRAGRIDVAVHSMKDLPAQLGADFRIAAVPPRENPRDALITRVAPTFAQLPRGARLGTSSPRRKFEALRLRPDLLISPLRGNVDTRLEKLGSSQLDAIILAMAGLRRLGRDSIALHELSEEEFLPAGGQGALAVEALAHDTIGGSQELERAIAALSDPAAISETIAERAFLAGIGASCASPVGVHAKSSDGGLAISARLFSLDGTQMIAARHAGAGTPQSVGAELARRVLAQGGRELLANG